MAGRTGATGLQRCRQEAPIAIQVRRSVPVAVAAIVAALGLAVLATLYVTSPAPQEATLMGRITAGPRWRPRAAVPAILGLIWGAGSLVAELFGRRQLAEIKLSSMVGAADIDFETHPDFSSAYRLCSSDEPATRALFSDPSLLDLLVRGKGWYAECSGKWLGLYRLEEKVPRAALPQFLQRATPLFRSFTGR